MKDGVYEVAEARLCVGCQIEMEDEYLTRCMGEMRKDRCDRCGQTKSVTMNYRYLMKGRVKRKRGFVE